MDLGFHLGFHFKVSYRDFLSGFPNVHVGCFGASLGFISGCCRVSFRVSFKFSFRVSLGLHLVLHLGFHLGFCMVLFRVSFSVSLGFHLRVSYRDFLPGFSNFRVGFFRASLGFI